MRKKSHISLAGYLVRGTGLRELKLHKKAFCFGSIQPDLNPKMLAVPHEFDTTYGPLRELLAQLPGDAVQGEERALWRRAGVAMHYLADYFTWPHNAPFEGNLKQHCLYESEMKHCMRVLVWLPESQAIYADARETAAEIGTMSELFAYITRTHARYVRQREHTPISDCRQIMSLCAVVLTVLTELVRAERMREDEALCA